MSGKRKSETAISAVQEEKKPKDSGATSTNTMTLQADTGQPSDQQGGHLWGFGKLAALNGRPVASGGAGGAPVFGRSIQRISTRVGTLSPPITTSPPDFQTLRRP